MSTAVDAVQGLHKELARIYTGFTEGLETKALREGRVLLLELAASTASSAIRGCQDAVACS